MAAATVFSFVLSACSVATQPAAAGPEHDWPTYGRDNANSVNDPAETRLSPESVADLQVAWHLEDIGGVTGTPAIVGGIVYFADWQGIARAVKAADGSVLWEQQVTDVPISASVAVTASSVVVADLGGVLHKLDRETGEVEWSENLNVQGASLFASPVVVGDSVVIGMTETELASDDPAYRGDPEFRASVVAVDIADGSERWRLYTDPDDGSGTFVPVWSSVAYDPERHTVYVGTGNTNGQMPTENSATDLPLANGVLAIDVYQNDATMKWFSKLVDADRQRDLDVGASPNLFTIDGRDVVGAGAKSGDYVVLDREAGSEVWATHLSAGSAAGGVLSTAAVGDGFVYVASNTGGPTSSTIFALDKADGSVAWQYQFDGPIMGGSLALANGVIYRSIWSPPSAGQVVALDARDGTLLWSDVLGGLASAGISVSNGHIFVGYGLGTTPQQLRPASGGLVAYALP